MGSEMCIRDRYKPAEFSTSQIPLEAPESEQRDASQRRLAQSIKDPVVADQSQPFSSREYCTQVQCQSGLRAAREKKGRREAAAGDDAADGRALEIHLRTAATARAAQRVRRLEALFTLQHVTRARGGGGQISDAKPWRVCL